MAYAIGPAVVLLLTMTYLVAPEFYLAWVIELEGREHQIVEVLTFIAAATAGVLLAAWTGRAYRRAPRGERVGVVAVGIVALATLFFAAEEISWGQTYLGWRTPEGYPNLAGETNLHNTALPVRSLGSLFLLAVFFGLPLVWRLRDRLPWPPPAGLRCAVAEGPVIACAATGFLWQEVKTLYRWVHADYAQRLAYIQFFEQINEHKELLFAIALLLYALLRFRHRPTG